MKHSMTILALFMTLLPAANLQAAIKLKSFETDYCTMFLDGPPDRAGLWKHCCLEHDVRYWFGGTQNEMDISDLKLKSCVNKVAGDNWASLIYFGVRSGHHSPVKNKYQWSWGWEKKREMKPLSKEETAYVIEELKLLNLEEINMGDFIRENFPATLAK